MQGIKNLLIVLALTGWFSSANAGVIIDVTEVAGDVVFTSSGSLNLTGATQLGGFSGYGLGFISGGSNWYVASGLGTSVDNYALTSFAGAFGTNGAYVSAPISSTGNNFYIWGNGGGVAEVAVEVGYISGSLISSSMTFGGSTISGFGMIAGSYEYNLPGDLITLNIGTSSVPEPSILILLALGLLGLGLKQRRLLS